MTLDKPLPKSIYWGAILAIVLLHAMFLWGMGRWLWDREHYQFFPIVLAASAGLAWFRLQDATWPNAARITPRVVCYGLVTGLVFGLACFSGSDWLGTLSAIAGLWTTIWIIGGERIANRLRGPVALLLLAVPLPLNLDLSLIINLQKTATSAASFLLDGRGITHTVSGVAIRTDLREFMVEEACSGIHSLFSCLAVMAFWSACFRYGIVRLCLTLGQTVVWVVMANCLRVFLIVFCRHRYSMDLETGMAHELLGVGTYAGALLMALSTDQLLRFLWPVSFVPFQKESLAGGYGGYGDSDSSNNSFGASLNASKKRVNGFLNHALLKGRTAMIAAGALAVLVFLPLASYAAIQKLPAATETSSNTTGGSNQQSFAARFSAVDLPENVGSWQRTDFDTVERSPDDPLGTNSSVWTYSGHGLVVRFSIDGFYPSWHDLSYCYTGLDWKLESAENREIPETDTEYTLLNLYKDTGEYASSRFACFDQRNECVPPQEVSGSVVRTLINRLRSGGLTGSANTDIQPPVYQVQAMAISGSVLLDHEKELIDSLFEELHAEALALMAKGTEGSEG